MGYVGKVTAGGATHLVGSTLYGTCTTGAGTAAKVVTCSDFTTLLTGVTIHVKFTNSNTASSPTLNVNSTGAKTIYRYGSTVPGTTSSTSWIAGAVVSFTYDGTNWVMNDNQAADTTGLVSYASAQSLTSAQKTQAQSNIGLSRVTATNVSVAASAWVADSTYTDFPYRASVSVSGATADLYPEVIFSPTDALSGNYAPVAESGTDLVYIYAKEDGAVAMTIPTIIVH